MISPQQRAGGNIHRDDCAGVLRHLLGLEAPEPCYVAVDDEPAERREVLAWLARRLGVPAPAPAAGPRAEDSGAAEAGRGGGGLGKRCRNARLVASGYRFRFPSFREGYAALLDAGGGGSETPASR